MTSVFAIKTEAGWKTVKANTEAEAIYALKSVGLHATQVFFLYTMEKRY